ncbi:MAG: exodeoxyribonuclease VII small subunit [Cytophagaceae bacterium]|nr:MAG: exodeoxyribonuclease VII small subunit [Cytophagaceae bacterium]
MTYNPLEVTYNEAIQELETILRSLETDQVDVDDLTARAERSAELIRLCRHKLRHAEASLDRVFDSLDENDDEEPEEEAEDEPEIEDEDSEEDDETDDYHTGGPGRPSAPRLF